MAILGKTTLISGECYNDFITKGKQLIGTSSVLSNIPGSSSESNPLQVNGYAVAKGFKIPNGDANSLLCADGTSIDKNELNLSLDPCGGLLNPVYVNSDGEMYECNIFGLNSNGVALQNNSGILIADKKNQATIPGHLLLYADPDDPDYVRAHYCCLDVTGSTRGVDLVEWTIAFTGGNKLDSVKLHVNGGFFQTSDIRKKENLKDLDLNKCYELIDKCQTVLFDYKEGAKDQIGMIAQEVEEFFPEIISTDANGFKSLDYAKLTVVILRVLKDLIKKVNG